MSRRLNRIHIGTTTAISPPLRPRLSAAVAAGGCASWASRVTKLGAGGTIGGRVTLLLASDALTRLASGRTIVLVSGTNGKTTTTHLLAAALRQLGPVATNHEGANMPEGLVRALGRDRRAPYAVLEVDESYLPQVASAVHPAAIVVLNLTRDQLDRVGEVRQLEARLRSCFAGLPGTLLVANADDRLVSSAAGAAQRVLWVRAGESWSADGGLCTKCGRVVAAVEGPWSCRCEPDTRAAAWALDGDDVLTPDGRKLPLDLRIPGRASRADATMALATALEFGVPVAIALDAIRHVSAVNERYRVLRIGGLRLQLLLAKNPAGWLETLGLLSDREVSVVLAVNGREADGRDLSWLWDVPFERLNARHVVILGERQADLAVRLAYAGIPFAQARNIRHALSFLPPGAVDVVANYTSFRDITKELAHAG